MTILIATIGTRELMYQTHSGEWYNVGDDRLQNGKIIGEQLEVIEDLGLNWEKYKAYRDLTEYIWENKEDLVDLIQPVIIGKLLLDKHKEIREIYLIVTNQNESVQQREKDTIYAGQIIKYYCLEKLNKNLKITIITIGENGENPSEFEQVFRWWQQIWRSKITVNKDEEIILCLKGGVGQTSEASRISGLSLYGEQIQFYEFKQNDRANRKGTPSDYFGPFLGTNYLWDRVRKESLQLLNNYNYAAVEQLLEPYFKQDTKTWSSIPKLIKAGKYWQQGQFESFYTYAQQSLDQQQQRQEKTYWWMAYEQAYTAIIRLEQKNTTEAMLHSFRAVEGLILKYIQDRFAEHIIQVETEYPQLQKTIFIELPNLNLDFKGENYLRLEGLQQIKVIETAIPSLTTNQYFQAWQKRRCRTMRNNLSHRLGGISETELFNAWDTHNEQDWKKSLVSCLNAIADQHFSTLSQASLFACIHHLIKKKITSQI